MSSAFHRQITIYFADGTTTMSPHELAFACGLKPAEVLDAVDGLVAHGYLTPRDDGAYDATRPKAARTRRRKS